MARRLLNKRCLIVGGGSGIGLAAARRFVQEGARLVVADRLPDDEGRLAGLGLAGHLLGDASDPGQVERLCREAAERLGGLDVLYHVAGMSGRRLGDGSLHECSDAGWHDTLTGNLTCTFLTNRAAVRHFLAARQPGVILNMASVLAWSPAPEHFDTCAYTAAKGAIIAMSRLAAARYAASGIRVNVLAPGLIDTPMAGRACGDAAIAAYLNRKQPLGPGPGRPEDLADAAVFLCGDESRLVTGTVLAVDGGWCVSEAGLTSL